MILECLLYTVLGNDTKFISDWIIVDIDNCLDGNKFWITNKSKSTKEI